MKFDIMLAGVGGQGILTIANMLDSAAVARGLHFKQAEVHGMAQRGGAVYSHLRLCDREVISDLIPEGQADMVLSVEPLEVQRYLHYLSRDGVVVSNDQPFKNIADYPEDQVVLDALLAFRRAVLIDAKHICEIAKNPRGQNMAVLGAAVPFLPFSLEEFSPLVENLFGSKGTQVVESNLTVLALGCKCGLLVKKLLESGVPSKAAHGLLAKQPLESLDPSCAAALARGALGQA
jgi:indolepyruvate ferredoxin oxidoreductase beta subunit